MLTYTTLCLHQQDIVDRFTMNDSFRKLLLSSSRKFEIVLDTSIEAQEPSVDTVDELNELMAKTYVNDEPEQSEESTLPTGNSGINIHTLLDVMYDDIDTMNADIINISNEELLTTLVRK